jgi:hypothetical protein
MRSVAFLCMGRCMVTATRLSLQAIKTPYLCRCQSTDWCRITVAAHIFKQALIFRVTASGSPAHLFFLNRGVFSSHFRALCTEIPRSPGSNPGWPAEPLAFLH